MSKFKKHLNELTLVGIYSKEKKSYLEKVYDESSSEKKEALDKHHIEVLRVNSFSFTQMQKNIETIKNYQGFFVVMYIVSVIYLIYINNKYLF